MGSLKYLLAGLALSPALVSTGLSVDVLTYRYNDAGTGANDVETVLNLDNVNPWSFGLKYTVPVNGQIYAQPLVKTAVGRPARSLVFVATQANVVMAVDTAAGIPVWTDTLSDIGSPVPSADVATTDIYPQIGICSTPVIYGMSLYVLSKAKHTPAGDNPHYAYTIYELNIATGRVLAENHFADTAYDGTKYIYRDGDPHVNGSGDGSITSGTQPVVYFNALREMNRAALSRVGDVIYAGFASLADYRPYHGWLIGFDIKNLHIVSLFNATPNGEDGGIWESGGRIASDGGALYFETGNGSFDPTQLNLDGFPIDGDYGDCVVKVVRDNSTAARPNVNGWGLKVVDYFSPEDNDALNNADLDLGACGPIVVTYGRNTYLIGIGKDGTIYTMNPAKMGKYSPSANDCLQTITNAICIQGQPSDVWSAFCTPSFFNNRLYTIGGGDFIKQFVFTSGILSSWYLDGNHQVQTDVESDNMYSVGSPGAQTCISSNRNNGVILWAIDQGASVLRAYRASDLLEIWDSNQFPADHISSALKFTVPVVANGNVYVGAESALYIFGLATAPRH